jgi:deoxyribodipyrimidine photo-lyase
MHTEAGGGDTDRWVPTRAAGLERLEGLTDVVRRYGFRRNFATDGTTSRLSPYLRRRLVLEEEALALAHAAGPFEAVEKFVQEVLWRTYWKGWLEARPAVWAAYLDRLRALDDALPDADRDRVACATGGRTHLPYFNAWAEELVTTGWLHNHARMWFASVWVFTLKLPWELGARFFLDHLVDGDPASNTLSWRWVAGLQTPGKHYLARAVNIAKYTDGRWVPRSGELDESARPLPDDGLARLPAGTPSLGPAAGDVRPRAVLLHDEDCGPLPAGWAGAPAVRYTKAVWSHHAPSAAVDAFVSGARADADARAGAVSHADSADAVEAWCRSAGTTEVWTLRPLVGFAAAALAELSGELAPRGIAVRAAEREHDPEYFRYATRGYFPFWKAASALVRGRWK